MSRRSWFGGIAGSSGRVGSSGTLLEMDVRVGLSFQDMGKTVDLLFQTVDRSSV